MFAHRKHFDISDNNHFIVIFIENRVVKHSYEDRHKFYTETVKNVFSNLLSKFSSYPLVKNNIALAARSGVFNNPCLFTSSPTWLKTFLKHDAMSSNAPVAERLCKSKLA